MKLTRNPKESGLAALEFVIVAGLIFSLLALSAPLIVALQERVRLERVAGHTARFATAAPDRPRYGSVRRRPTVEEVKIEARRAYIAVGGPVPSANFDVVVAGVGAEDNPAKPGDPISITIIETVNLGPIGGLMDIIGVITSPNIRMTVIAVGRQE